MTGSLLLRTLPFFLRLFLDNLTCLLFIILALAICQNIKQANVSYQSILSLLNVFGILRVHILDLYVFLIQQVKVSNTINIHFLT